ncbi:MAG: flippase-like domain-containing protein [Acidobacteria bacterium]|nr:flippase-like domain-containing protein [Acidobacteriota bacterium]MDW7984816.1 lysylphosphatidylglycerol synthase domain-containing protein [Acidobacteriota bacterium]
MSKLLGHWSRIFLSVGLSGAVSVVLLGWVLQQVPEDLGTAWRQTASASALLTYGAISLLGTLLRTWRYRLLLGPWRPGDGPLFLVTLVRNFTVDMLPLRVGGLSFPLLLHYRLRVPWVPTWSCFVGSFVWDTAALALFLWVAWIHLTGVVPQAVWLVVLPVGLTVIVAGLLLTPDTAWRGLMRGVFRRRHRSPFRWGRRSVVRFIRFGIGLASAGSVWRSTAWGLGALSVGIRLCKYWGLYTLYQTYSSRLGSDAAVGFFVFIWTVTMAEMTALLPIQGLMNIGPWEAAWTLALRWVHKGQTAVAPLLSTFVHWTTQAWEYTIGGLALGCLLYGGRRIPTGPGRKGKWHK